MQCEITCTAHEACMYCIMHYDGILNALHYNTPYNHFIKIVIIFLIIVTTNIYI